MKKSLLVLGLIASMLVLANCASKSGMDQTAATDTTAPAAGHDYKGEMSTK